VDSTERPENSRGVVPGAATAATVRDPSVIIIGLVVISNNGRVTGFVAIVTKNGEKPSPIERRADSARGT
jgi:hypothetical protein